MKEKFKKVGIIVIVAVIVFSMTACGGNGSDEDAAYTVTFNSNGGSSVVSITDITSGSTITAPETPTTTAGGVTLNRFRGWYKDNDTFSNAWNFETDIVTENITLYADWGYRVGDIGPGGGKVYYRSETGFTVQMVDAVLNYTAHYLEAASVIISGMYQWASRNGDLIPDLSQNNSDQTDWVIGRGRKNTAIIMAHGIANSYTTPAASACNALITGGYTDWFLPSIDELYEYYQSASSRTNITNRPIAGYYWSSSQRDDVSSRLIYIDFDNGVRSVGQKEAESAVCAVRAF